MSSGLCSLRIGSRIIFLLSSLWSCTCQVELISSLGETETVCPDQQVWFFCTATGSLSNFAWFLNDVPLYAYRSSDTNLIRQLSNPNTTSVLIRDFTASDKSQLQLTFNTLPRESTFTIECRASSQDPGSRITTILREPPPAVTMAPVAITGSVANVSWTPNSNFTLYYEVYRDDCFFSEVRSTYVLIPINNIGGMNYNVKVIGVDMCGNRGAPANVTVTARTSTTDSFLTSTLEVEAGNPNSSCLTGGSFAAAVLVLILFLGGIILVLVGIFCAIFYCHTQWMKWRATTPTKPGNETAIATTTFSGKNKLSDEIVVSIGIEEYELIPRRNCGLGDKMRDSISPSPD